MFAVSHFYKPKEGVVIFEYAHAWQVADRTVPLITCDVRYPYQISSELACAEYSVMRACARLDQLRRSRPGP